MPKDKLIEATTDYLPDEKGNKILTEIKVYYSKKVDAFYTKCPHHLCFYGRSGSTKEKIGDGPVTVHKVDGLIWEDRPQKVIDELLSRSYLYLKAIQKKRKVIAYRINTEDDMPFEEGEGFLIGWKVGWELKIGDKVELLTYEPPDKSGEYVCNQTYLMGGDNVRHIEWTKEREEFFIGLSKAINDLKTKTKKFLDNPEDLSKFIESKGQLFLPERSNIDDKI